MWLLLLLFSHSGMSDSLQTHGTAAHQASLSFTIARTLLTLMSIKPMMPSNHFFCCHPFFLLASIFCSIRVFSNKSALFTSGGQSIGASASASVLPINIQYWFPLELNDLISLHQGTQESSPTQFKSINSAALSLIYGSTLTSIYDYWKNHTFDYMDLCQQSNVSAF